MKPLITLLIASLLMVPAGAHKKQRDLPFTEQQLTAWYDGFNDKYFQNQLPSNTVVIWSDLKAWDALGITSWSGQNYKIELDPDFNRTQVTTKATELHEMCHVKVMMTEDVPLGEEHGLAFQTCMMTLAREGAFERIW